MGAWNSREDNTITKRNCHEINSHFFWTIRYGQTVQTPIRLSKEKQSNQGLHCLQFCQYLYLVLFYKNLLVQFWHFYSKV